MPRSLVIVESPNKVKSISSYLGSDYVVMASYGLPTLSDVVGGVRDGTATPLTPGTPYDSVITTPGDKDVFSFTAPGGLATIQVLNAPANDTTYTATYTTSCWRPSPARRQVSRSATRRTSPPLSGR